MYANRLCVLRSIVPPPQDILPDPSSAYGNARPPWTTSTRDIFPYPSSTYGIVSLPRTSSLPRDTLSDPSFAYRIPPGSSSLPRDRQPELTVGPGIPVPPRSSSLFWNTPRSSRSANNHIVSPQSSSQSRNTRDNRSSRSANNHIVSPQSSSQSRNTRDNRSSRSFNVIDASPPHQSSYSHSWNRRHHHGDPNTANIVDVSPTGRPIISSSGRDSSPTNPNRSSRNSRNRSRNRNNITYRTQESLGSSSSRPPIRLSREEASLYNNSTADGDSIEVVVPRDDPSWSLDVTFHRSGGISVAPPGTTAISSRLRVANDVDDEDNDNDDGISDRYYRLGRDSQGNVFMRRLRLSVTPPLSPLSSLASSLHSTSLRSSSRAFSSPAPHAPRGVTAPLWRSVHGNSGYTHSHSSSSSHGHGYRQRHGHGHGHGRTYSHDSDSDNSNNGRSRSQRRRHHRHHHELAIAEAEEEEHHRRRERDREQQQRGRHTPRRNVTNVSGGAARRQRTNAPSPTPSLRRVLREGEEARRARTMTRRSISRRRVLDHRDADRDRNRRVSVTHSSSLYSSSPSSSD
jgi:hypothetical protein